jgi:hypothetical protein
MDQDTTLLMAFATLVVLNRAIFVGGFAIRFRTGFYLLQACNIAGASYFLAWGLPSFSGPTQLVNYMLAALLILHTVQNNGKYEKLLRIALAGDDEDHLAKRQAVLDKLKKSEEA